LDVIVEFVVAAEIGGRFGKVMSVLQIHSLSSYSAPDGSVIRELASPRQGGITSHSLADITLPPGTKVEAHFHKMSDEVYWVIEGAGEVLLEDLWHPVEAGSIVTIPVGTIHAVKSAPSTPLKMAVTCCPAWVPEDTYPVSH
jgi:mannose-6-phosphate isomerase-like protein (cupin superfamily)